MSLTEDMVLNYLMKVPSLDLINNHDVKDEDDCKTGQLPLTIQIGKHLIDQMLEPNSKSDEPTLTENEENDLFDLREALNSLPQSITSIFSIINLDEIQQNLLHSINAYLKNIKEVEQHKLLLKAVVLVLKIIEYDLSKNEGPIKYGYGFFKVEVLSNKERIRNHGQIKQLLTGIIEQFNDCFVKQSVPSPVIAVIDPNLSSQPARWV